MSAWFITTHKCKTSKKRYKERKKGIITHTKNHSSSGISFVIRLYTHVPILVKYCFSTYRFLEFQMAKPNMRFVVGDFLADIGNINKQRWQCDLFLFLFAFLCKSASIALILAFVCVFISSMWVWLATKQHTHTYTGVWNKQNRHKGRNETITHTKIHSSKFSYMAVAFHSWLNHWTLLYTFLINKYSKVWKFNALQHTPHNSKQITETKSIFIKKYYKN